MEHITDAKIIVTQRLLSVTFHYFYTLSHYRTCDDKSSMVSRLQVVPSVLCDEY